MTRSLIRARVRASGALNGSLWRRSASRTVSRSSGSLISSRSRSPRATSSISRAVSLAVRRATVRLNDSSACPLSHFFQRGYEASPRDWCYFGSGGGGTGGGLGGGGGGAAGGPGPPPPGGG